MVTARIVKKQLRARRLTVARARRRAGRWAGVGGGGAERGGRGEEKGEAVVE